MIHLPHEMGLLSGLNQDHSSNAEKQIAALKRRRAPQRHAAPSPAGVGKLRPCPRGRWGGVCFRPPPRQARSVPGCSAHRTQRPCPRWAALTEEGLRSSTVSNPGLLFMSWLPFSLAKTPSASPTRDRLSDVMSHSVSFHSPPPPSCLLNPMAVP